MDSLRIVVTAAPSTFYLVGKLWGHLSVRRRRQIIFLFALIIITSFAEMLSLSGVLPFLAMLTAPERILHQVWLQPVLHFLNVSAPLQILGLFTCVFSAAIILSGGMRIILLWITTRLSFMVGTDLGSAIYSRTLYQPYSVHVARNSSEVIDAISIKVSTVISSVVLQVLSLISSVWILASIVFVLMLLEPVASLVSFGIFGLIYGVMIAVTRKRLWYNSTRIANESTQIIKILQESLGGIRDIIIDSSQEVYKDAYEHADVAMRRAQGSNGIINASPRYAIESLGMLLIVFLGYFFVQQPNGVVRVVPLLATMALGAQRLLPLLQQTYAAWTMIQGGRASLQDLLVLLGQPLPHVPDHSLLEPLRFQKSIVLQQLSFRYSEKSPFIFKKLNLVISKASRIGFIGVTGTGKSTLLDIIMGLLEPTQGMLMVDEHPITKSNCRAWQSHIAHVPQNIYLADCSIEQNIAFGVPKNEINHERVKEAAHKAQISSLIESYPQQYQTMVGERGVRLSGGQKQRIGIARALYKEADVIIFDEATSALDHETEQHVMKTIESLGEDITVLIIAHRLTTLKHCTQIVELKDGYLSYVGTYKNIAPSMV